MWGLKLDNICKLLKNCINFYPQVMKINSYHSGDADMITEEEKRIDIFTQMCTNLKT